MDKVFTVLACAAGAALLVVLALEAPEVLGALALGAVCLAGLTWLQRRSPRRARQRAAIETGPDGEQVRVLEVSCPWWVHPAAALVIMAGFTALISVLLPQEAYDTWRSPKFLDDDAAAVLLIAIVSMLLGILLTGYRVFKGGRVRLKFGPRGIRFLRKLYRWLLVLTMIGYAFWAASAVAQGIGLADLSAVVDREPGAISELKASSRPIAGVTTLTQFGPVAIVVGYLLYRLGVGKRGFLVILALSAVRTLFYAERLALLEVLLPLVLAWSLLASPNSRRRRAVKVAPLVLAPLVWLVFAASEYTRSWVYYQQTTALPFTEWVSLRLLGYYTTSYNNSALYASAYAETDSLPFASIPGIWNAPILEQVMSHPGMSGVPAGEWWAGVLRESSNPEFNNPGSFLVTYAEFGWFMVVFWLVCGMLFGRIFSALRAGSVPAFAAYCALFVGLLELPRFIYWTQGRAFPIIIALVIAWLAYPRWRRPKAATAPASRSSGAVVPSR